VTIGIGSLELETAIHGMRGSQRDAIVIGVADVLRAVMLDPSVTATFWKVLLNPEPLAEIE
jgi:hypothetical protein